MLTVNDKHSKSSFTHLGLGTSFEGNITIPHDIHLYGKFIGNIDSKGSITLGTKGFVKGNIVAKSAIIGGRVEGSINCNGSIELESSSVLIGDISASELIIHKGSKFMGKSSMGEPQNE